jgi:hypothetical protein
VDQFQTDSFRKKILDLFKMRRVIKQKMTVSGTANFHACLEVAKALNDVEELRNLMEEAKTSLF